MPAYTPTEDEMGMPAEEAESPEAPETEEPEAEAPETIDEEEAAMGTAVVDNKVLSPDGNPLKEGDTVTLTVVKNYGEESEVKVASAGKVQPPETSMESADAELDQMSEE